MDSFSFANKYCMFKPAELNFSGSIEPRQEPGWFSQSCNVMSPLFCSTSLAARR